MYCDKYSELRKKVIKIISATVLLMFFCGTLFSQNLTLVEANPYLVGQWSGTGNFLDVDIRNKVGEISLVIEIFQDGRSSVKFDKYSVKDAMIAPAKYGFEIRGKLESFKKNGVDLKKDKLVILLVLPETDRANVTESDANFHLKSNFIFDLEEITLLFASSMLSFSSFKNALLSELLTELKTQQICYGLRFTINSLATKSQSKNCLAI